MIGLNISYTKASSKIQNTLSGEWELIEISKAEKFTKLHFNQYNERLCHVLFNNTDGTTNYSENTTYTLIGWQKMRNRHNILLIE